MTSLHLQSLSKDRWRRWLHLVGAGRTRLVAGIVRTLSAIPLMAALGACDDEPSATLAPMSAGGASNGVVVADPTSDRWNRFEADVYVAVDGSPTRVISSMKLSRGFSYHLTRHRDTDGNWVTDMDLGEYRPRLSSTLPTPGSAPITRISGGSRTTVPRFTDANGQTRFMPTLTAPPRVAATPGVRPDTRARREVPTLPTVPARATRLPSDTSRDWADVYFVSARSAGRLRANLARHADEVSSADGRSRFLRSRQGHTTEVVLDDTTGQIREMRALENGKVLAITTREYAEVGPGVQVLRSERTTRYSRNEALAPMVITTIYRNVRVLEER